MYMARRIRRCLLLGVVTTLQRLNATCLCHSLVKPYSSGGHAKASNRNIDVILGRASLACSARLGKRWNTADQKYSMMPPADSNSPPVAVRIPSSVGSAVGSRSGAVPSSA